MKLKTGIRIFLLAMPVFFFYSCQKDHINATVENPLLKIPKGFPSVEWPSDNAFTQERWELGKKLFFDPILSKDSSISCASCHLPSLAFSDDQPTSTGAFNRPGTRNAPTLGNVAYQPYYLREGSVPTLEMQVLVPIQEQNEFAHNIVDIAEELKAIKTYVDLSKSAYNREPDAFVITRAIATFERTLISGNSAYDQFLNGNETALSESQKRGMDLFFSEKTNCSQCHSGFNLTNYNFENNGLYETYLDIGRERITNNPDDNGRFKIPSLRNIELTGPYMHDGSISTLETVIEHYNSGGKSHHNKSPFIKELNLSPQQKEDMVEFLISLTDYSFCNNPVFSY